MFFFIGLIRILLKIVFFPIVAALTVAVLFLSFVVGCSSALLGVIASIMFLLAIPSFFYGDFTVGIGVWIMAFLISPYGLPRLAEWIVDKLDDLNLLIKDLIYS